MIPTEHVAAVVARGKAEIGFQQVSELLPIPRTRLPSA
jgi:molybdate transport system substrate-binding protein